MHITVYWKKVKWYTKLVLFLNAACECFVYILSYMLYLKSRHFANNWQMRLNDIQMKKFQSIEKIFIDLKKKRRNVWSLKILFWML